MLQIATFSSFYYIELIWVANFKTLEFVRGFHTITLTLFLHVFCSRLFWIVGDGFYPKHIIYVLFCNIIFGESVGYTVIEGIRSIILRKWAQKICFRREVLFFITSTLPRWWYRLCSKHFETLGRNTLDFLLLYGNTLCRWLNELGQAGCWFSVTIPGIGVFSPKSTTWKIGICWTITYTFGYTVYRSRCCGNLVVCCSRVGSSVNHR